MNRDGTGTEVHKHGNSEPSLPVSQNVSVVEVASARSENEALKRRLDDAEKKLSVSKKKIKVLQQSKRRLTKRNSDLKSVISALKRKHFISEDRISLLEKC